MVILTNFPPPTEGIKIEQPCTTVFFNQREIGKGSLFVSESRLSWVNSTSGEGFSLEYPHIAIHAISRDIQAFGHECIYLMVETGSEMEEHYVELSAHQYNNRKQALQADNAEESPEDDNSDSGNENMTSGMIQMRFVPDDKGSLDAIYHALNECSALHPDPTDSFSDEDDIFEDADEEGEYHLGNGGAPYIGYAEGFERINGRNQDEAMDTDGQFEDADFVPDE